MADYFVARGKRNEVSKTFHSDGVAVVKMLADGGLERNDFSHGSPEKLSRKVFALNYHIRAARRVLMSVDAPFQKI